MLFILSPNKNNCNISYIEAYNMHKCHRQEHSTSHYFLTFVTIQQVQGGGVGHLKYVQEDVNIKKLKQLCTISLISNVHIIDFV